MNTVSSLKASMGPNLYSGVYFLVAQQNVQNQKILELERNMEELTPEQKLLQEAIRSRVKTLKFFRTHLRWAGIVAQLVGVLLSNTAVLLLGTLVFLFSYMVTVGIMEDINLLIWDQNDEKKEDGEDKTEE